ncbi:alpha/beta fold hydrolase [Desulfospira joergensenii]|uniref:alpha/beta fold hydrolase n=1 Tax=Desulfospira joergensenii TaxID=53329 RepID=UPI0003B503E2|nr:alpha/beta fold hydrolase [Desulfospira joergensenii]
MNPVVFELSSYTLKALSGFSKARIRIEGKENIPDGSVIFCANHFTRIETIFLPFHIHSITQKDVWSLAAKDLFELPLLEALMTRFGAVSTGDPHRDDLILKTLLPGDGQWIIFPEGMLVKNKKLIKKNQFYLKDDIHVSRPHTGPAVAALRCEFFRERLRRLQAMKVSEFERLAKQLNITDMDRVLKGSTYIVPVNITYYPARPRENILASLAGLLMKTPSKRVMDEIMTEGGVLFAGVDITIRFGPPITMTPYLRHFYLESMLSARRRIHFSRDIHARQLLRRLSLGIMENYMSSVYSMITLNHDHVMACILKHLPYRENGFDVYEFKAKVYYAIAGLRQKKVCHFSDHLNLNQIHLLTDDRFKKISEFLDLALATGVIQKDGIRMIKNQARFFQASNFHSIRSENPILVMANEVEPVGEVEDFLKTIARKSGPEIMEAVGHGIRAKIQEDFTRDYADHFMEGESKKKRIGRPLFMDMREDRAGGQPDGHGKERPGILLIHGYMAAPEEMKQFAQFLHENGFTVFAPRLRGHGTSPEDLARTTYEQWMESAEEAYVALRHTCTQTFIGGFSTGAGLALELATRVEDFQAVFAVAPPMRLNDLGAYFVPAIDTWNSMIRKMKLGAIAKEFISNNPENPRINYKRNPIAGIRQLEKLMVQLEPKLKTLEKPVLVAQSRKDPVVSTRGTGKLFQLIGSPFKEYYLFDYDRHGILNGKDSNRVFQAILNFIREWA